MLNVIKYKWLKFKVSRLFNKLPSGWDYTTGELAAKFNADPIDISLICADIAVNSNLVDIIFKVRSQNGRESTEYSSLSSIPDELWGEPVKASMIRTFYRKPHANK